MKLYVINGTTREGIAGSDSNNGLTPSTPKATLGNLLSTYSTTVNDTIYAAGIHEGTFTTPAYLKQWDGQERFWITGSQDTRSIGNFAISAGTTYRLNIGSGVNVVNVVANWLAREDANGRHYGWYAEGTVTAGELTADKRWDYVDPFLYIRDDSLFTGGVTPNTLTGMNAVRFCTNDDYLIGLDHRSSSATRISDVSFAHFLTKVGTTYGYYGGGDVLAQRLKVYDCEIHGIVFANDPNNNSVAEDCEVWGAGTTADYNALVWYNAGDVSGARGIRAKIRPYSQLDPDGTEHDATIGLNGMYAHTDGGGGNTVNDCLWVDPDIKLFNNPGNYFSAANPATVSDYDAWDGFPFRVLRGVCLGAKTTQYLQTNIGFRGTLIDTTGTAGTNSLAVASTIFAVGAGFAVLLDSCVHVTNSDDPTSTGRRIYYILSGAALSQINTTTIDQSTAGSAYNHSMFQYQSAAVFSFGVTGFMNRARGCIFYFKTAHAGNYFAYFDGGVSNTANYVFDGNWVYNVGAGARWAENTLYDTQAEWQSVIDANAVIGTNPSFLDDTSLDPSIAGMPAASSTVWTSTYKPTVYGNLGYNGRKYSHNRGAYQRGPGPGHTGRRRVAAGRAAVFGMVGGSRTLTLP